MNTEQLKLHINKRLREHPQHKQYNLVLYPGWLAEVCTGLPKRKWRRKEGSVITFFVPYKRYSLKRAFDLAGMRLDKIFILQDADSNITDEAMCFIKTRNSSNTIIPFCETYKQGCSSGVWYAV